MVNYTVSIFFKVLILTYKTILQMKKFSATVSTDYAIIKTAMNVDIQNNKVFFDYTLWTN